MEGDQTVIEPPESIGGSNKAAEKKPMTFSFGEPACADSDRESRLMELVAS